ncbi:glycosyltransferase [Paraburkholderia sp. BL10I2N1]|uniref:glycosyltransferase n=1 Tax=Paraburkholderia sp. BL10I2N1 TaxID=1938796 RepID=UPI003261892B
MRALFHHHQMGVRAPRRPLVNAVKAELFRRALRSSGMKTLLSIDPTLCDWCARATVRHGTAIDYLPDPSPDVIARDPSEARRRLQLTAGKHLLVYGAITDKKGIRELFDALSRRRDAPTVIVAGEQDADMRAYIEGAAARLTPGPAIVDRFITEDFEQDLFAACDAIWLGYKGHYGMSGVLVQAYRFKKPVIATADGLIGWFCRNGEMGPVIADLSSDTINHAVDQLFPHGPATPSIAAVSATHLLAQNTLSQFKKTLQLAIA